MQAVQALPASFGSSLRSVSTSNGAGSRAAGSRGPWSSAELATRPVRKRASETQGKRARFKENADQQSSDPRDGKGVK